MRDLRSDEAFIERMAGASPRPGTRAYFAALASGLLCEWPGSEEAERRYEEARAAKLGDWPMKKPPPYPADDEGQA